MQKTVFFAGLIGLLFGFLFAGTLGIDFFPNEPVANENDEMDTITLDAEGFRVAYNLTESIYEPISGAEVYNKIDNEDTFIVYVGRDTCPYCQQFVPVLMDVAEELDISVLYHVDSTDSLNSSFISVNNITGTPTTFVFREGNLVEAIVGYRNATETQQLIEDALS